MALYIPSQELVQVGLEAAYGDLAVPTVQLVGVIEPKITPHPDGSQIKDKRGTTMPAHVSTLDRVWAEASVPGVLNYQHFKHWLDCLFGIDAGASPFSYLAELDPTTTIRSLNLCYGQTGLTHSMGGSIVDRLTIKGGTNGPLTFIAHLLGKGVVDDTLESLSDDAVVYVMGHHCALDIDPITGTIGTTPVTVTAFNFELDIAVDRKLVWHMGSINPDNFRHGKWKGGLKLGLEMTVAMHTILDEILAETVSPHGYMVRITATDALATSILELDFAGESLNAPNLYTYEDDIVTMELDLVPKFTTDATFLSCYGAKLTLP